MKIAKEATKIETLAQQLSSLIVDGEGKQRWTRSELLLALGWQDRFTTRFLHQFPVGHYAQRNVDTEQRLSDAIKAHASGYLSLVGPPGVGKSTLLQRGLREQASIHVVRYLAFAPGSALGQGRGEAAAFLDDVNSALVTTGLSATRAKDDSVLARQQTFDRLLSQAGERYARDGTRWIVVIDGLDHVPREEKPEHSFLAVLPLPQNVPAGVTIVLGTQRLDLADMPPAVRQQASADGRSVTVAPLTAAAVGRLADALKLPAEIDRAAIHKVARGHALLTHYLIERLITADEAVREQILSGDHGFSGDLEHVYDAAWRAVATAQSQDVAGVLAIIAHAQGPIEPEVLAKATSAEAVERTVREVGHLLQRSKAGWTVFHNSFRLFLGGKSVLRFGAPDPDFQPTALYRRLAELTADAGPSSPQRWLAFRYLYLAGQLDAALELAGRAYFSAQYCAGRPMHEVRGDISDAFRALKDREDPAKLFDVLLADDEVERRASVLEGAESLVEAYLAAGDVEAALTALKEGGSEAGDQWLVIDALLEAGDIGRARDMFEQLHPLRCADRNVLVQHDQQVEHIRSWATFAVLLLDKEQLQQALDECGISQRDDETETEVELVSILRFSIAQTLVRRARADVAGIAQEWGVQDGVAALHVEAAEAAAARGDREEAVGYLAELSAQSGIANLDVSWLVAGAQCAVDLNRKDVALTLISHAPLRGLSAMGTASRFSQIAEFCRQMAENAAVRAQLGLQLPQVTGPEDRLLRGAQHQLLLLAEALGKARAGNACAELGISRMVAGALHFLAAARVQRDEDVFTTHLIPRVAEVIGDVIFELLATTDGGEDVGVRIDADIAGGTAIYRHWHAFRRIAAIGSWRLDGDAAVALRRLEAGLSDLTESDPREEMEERAAYAMALSAIGREDRALAILAELRNRALGIFLPAKKDGKYELWVDVLTRANEVDPAGRAARADVALRMLDGLTETEGSNMAGRIGRTFLFEAAAGDAPTALAAAQAAARSGAISWDGICEALLCGVVARDAALANAAVTIWTYLCLPWYEEPHGSTNETARFVSLVIAECEPADIHSRERRISDAIEARARPNMKSVLLRHLYDVALERGGGALALAALERWAKESAHRESSSPTQASYLELTGLNQVASALLKERGTQSERGISYELRRAIVRILRRSSWAEAHAFAKTEPELCNDTKIAEALIRLAINAGDNEAAQRHAAEIADPLKEGWSWSAGYGRLQYYEAQHLLGKSGVHAAARAAFCEDMAASPYGTLTTLWNADRIFPALFENVPWNELWTLLEAQIRASREFEAGREPPVATTGASDAKLLAELLAWGVRLPISALRSEAAACAEELVEHGESELFSSAVELLLAIDGEPIFLALSLLSAAPDHTEIVSRFSARLPALARHPDAAVATAALRLGRRWGVSCSTEQQPLPPIYTLHLPPERVGGGGSADAITRGAVLDDPLAWTEGWIRLVRSIATDAGVDSRQIRRRVGQLMNAWGGVEAFGHAASKRLEIEAGLLGLKMNYRRPQSEGTIRALRYVLAELWRAGRLKDDDLSAHLEYLHSHPFKLALPRSVVRPLDVPPQMTPEFLWGEKCDQWLNEIASDTERAADVHDPCMIAEWRRHEIRRVRVGAVVEVWRSNEIVGEEPANLDSVLDELPRVGVMDGPVPLYDTGEISPTFCAYLIPSDVMRVPERLLVLCPYAAADLEWRADRRAAHVYRDASGLEMARTIWWRDGLPQPVDEDARVAEGQRVVLSQKGRERFEARFGVTAMATMAWRRTEVRPEDGEGASRFVTIPPR